MHYTVKKSLTDWYMALQPKPSSVAYLGSYDLNGSIADTIDCLGFDITPGPGVDVVLQPGIIPDEYKNSFELVISISAFQFCPNPEKFKNEALDLLIPKGILFLTCCAWSCRQLHSSSPGTNDSIRMSESGMRSMFENEFDIFDLQEISWNGHSDLILVGIKKDE